VACPGAPIPAEQKFCAPRPFLGGGGAVPAAPPAWLGDGVGEYRLPTEVIAVGRRQYMFTYIHTYAYERYIYIYQITHLR
jgi:hypothetical protein